MKRRNDISFKWVPIDTLSHKIRNIVKTYGDYGIASLQEGYRVIIDHKNSTVLMLKPSGYYNIPYDWDYWLEKGLFLVEAGPYRCIVDSKSAKVVIKGHEFKADAFLAGRSDYFVVKNNKNKQAIFDKDFHRISDWFGGIYHEFGLLEGLSDYYIASKNGKQAIFHKDGYRISKWYDWIDPSGLVNDNGNYYLVRKHDKDAVFDKDGKRITGWFDLLDPYGLIAGLTDYYIAKKDGKHAIFHKNGKQVTEWIDGDITGSLIGDSNSNYYYVVTYKGLSYIGKLGTSNKIGPFREVISMSQDAVEVKTIDYELQTITKKELEQFFEGEDINHGRER
jgi:hypothetical protein